MQLPLRASAAASGEPFGKTASNRSLKALRSLEIIGLQIAERALVQVARIGRAQHLELEECRALGRVARQQQNGQRRRQLAARGIEQARAHAGRGTSAILAHGDLPDAALPGEKLLAQDALAADDFTASPST